VRLRRLPELSPSPELVTQAYPEPGCESPPTCAAPPAVERVVSTWFYWDGQKDSIWAHAILPVTAKQRDGRSGDSLRNALQEYYAADYSALFGKHLRPRPTAPGAGPLWQGDGGLFCAPAFGSPRPSTRAAAFEPPRSSTSAGNDETQVKAEKMYLGSRSSCARALHSSVNKGRCSATTASHNIGVSDGEPTWGARPPRAGDERPVQRPRHLQRQPAAGAAKLDTWAKTPQEGNRARSRRHPAQHAEAGRSCTKRLAWRS